MVAADDQEGDLQIGRYLRRDIIKEFDSLCRRQAAVVDIAGQDNGVDAFVPEQGQELLFQDIGLVFGQVVPIE